MRRGSAVALVALVLLGLSGAPTQLSGAPKPALPVSLSPATIEPTLPLMIDLRLTGQRSGAQGGVARLEVSLDAGASLAEAVLTLVLPEGLKAEDGPLARGLQTSLRGGEHREYVVPLNARRAGLFPVRLHASFRLEDGRTYETNQAVLLRLGVRVPVGRSNAGAYEFMGVPLQELSR